MEIRGSAKEFIEGKIILINKPINWSSFDVVKKIKFSIREKYKIKKLKVGHAGTLDPLATGLLIICTGKKTKKISEIQNMFKIYEGEITLGGKTPSYDLETEITENLEIKHITNKLIKETTKKFIGEINQKPPMFSALKKNGERLYKKARRGELIDLPERKINVMKFDITKINMPKVIFKIKCSKGTYIRSIAHDFGLALNSGGYISKLCRTSIGDYDLKDASNILSFIKNLK